MEGKKQIFALDCDSWSGYKIELVAVFFRLKVFFRPENLFVIVNKNQLILRGSGGTFSQV